MNILYRLLLSSACSLAGVSYADANPAACARSNEIDTKIALILKSMTPADIQSCSFLERILKMKEQRLRLIYSDPQHCNSEEIIAKILDNNQKLRAHKSELGCPGR